MTIVYLLRHAAHDRVDSVLCGRMAGVTLGDTGRTQAGALAERMRGLGATAVLTSPLERARETAAPVASVLGITAEITPALIEIDLGDWTGRRFDQLAADPLWKRWNEARAESRPPRGESMGEVQARILDLLGELARSGETTILVTHGDVIRAAVLGILGLSLDRYDRFDIDPASMTTLSLWPGGGKVIGLNERGDGNVTIGAKR